MKKCESKTYNITIQVNNDKSAGIRRENICYKASKQVRYEAQEDCPNASKDNQAERDTNQQIPDISSTSQTFPKTTSTQENNTNISSVPPIPVAAIAGGAGGGLVLVIALSALGVKLFRRRQRAVEVEEMEMNTDINNIYGTYGECGGGGLQHCGGQQPLL